MRICRVVTASTIRRHIKHNFHHWNNWPRTLSTTCNIRRTNTTIRVSITLLQFAQRELSAQWDQRALRRRNTIFLHVAFWLKNSQPLTYLMFGSVRTAHSLARRFHCYALWRKCSRARSDIGKAFGARHRSLSQSHCPRLTINGCTGGGASMGFDIGSIAGASRYHCRFSSGV